VLCHPCQPPTWRGYGGTHSTVHNLHDVKSACATRTVSQQGLCWPRLMKRLHKTTIERCLSDRCRLGLQLTRLRLYPSSQTTYMPVLCCSSVGNPADSNWCQAQIAGGNRTSVSHLHNVCSPGVCAWASTRLDLPSGLSQLPGPLCNRFEQRRVRHSHTFPWTCENRELYLLQALCAVHVGTPHRRSKRKLGARDISCPSTSSSRAYFIKTSQNSARM
jgi:hypothetical protein